MRRRCLLVCRIFTSARSRTKALRGHSAARARAAAGMGRVSRRVRRKGSAQGRMESDRSDEWMKPAVPEARRTRRIILLARVPTTFSRYTHARARTRAPLRG